MKEYSKSFLTEKAKELSVVRDTLEKVYRLNDMLQFLNETPILRDNLALKGGTAINLLIFKLPRLSVDIDLDFCQNTTRAEMFTQRERIQNMLGKYTAANGYTISSKSKFPHSLDSFVFDYYNSAGVKDNIKVEINYSLRSHVFQPQQLMTQAELGQEFSVNALSPMEIYAAKTVALMTRAAVRDLYDINYMVKHKLFDASQLEMYRKCVIFYLAVATEKTPVSLDFSALDTITQHRVFTDLYPVIRDRDAFTLPEAQNDVKAFLNETLFISEQELAFLKNFAKGSYKPELLFLDKEIIDRIGNHPMAIWKTQNNREIIAEPPSSGRISVRARLKELQQQQRDAMKGTEQDFYRKSRDDFER